MIFKHKPKLGDIIYSLPFIEYMGGGTLYLDPDSEFFKGQRSQWIEKYKWIMPLIQMQEYIDEVKIYDGEPFDIDLDEYMNTSHLTYGDEVNIVDNHFIAQGEKPQPYKPWLKVDKLTVNKTVVANSGNYNGNVDYTKLLQGKEFVFVGHLQEACNFDTRYDLEFCHYVTDTSIMLAEVINGADLFIGNQSLPLAIALGLGKKCYVEQAPNYPNCIMGNYVNICKT